MAAGVEIRPVRPTDYEAWLPLWDGYNEFYGRAGATALDPAITETTWKRFFDPGEPVFALVAEAGGSLEGLAHYLYHRSTTRVEPVCYLQDLYTTPARRAHGIGRARIEGVYAEAGRRLRPLLAALETKWTRVDVYPGTDVTPVN